MRKIFMGNVMRKKLLNLTIILFTTAVFVILIFFTNGTNQLIQLLAGIKYRWIAAAFGCMVMYWVMDSFIILSITRALFENQRFADSIKITMVGQFFNAITPFAAGGQPAQAYVMIKDGIRAGHAISILIVKSVLYQATLLLYTLMMVSSKAPFFAARIPHFFLLYFIGVAVNASVISLYLLFLYNRAAAQKVTALIFGIIKKIGFLKKLEGVQEKFEAGLKSFNNGAAMLRNAKSTVLKSLVFQVMQLTFYFLIPYFIYLAVESGEASIWNMIAAQSVVTMITLMVPTPGSAGGAEGTGYLFFSMFFSPGVVLPVVLIWRLITYYSVVAFGGLVSVFAPEKPLKAQ